MKKSLLTLSLLAGLATCVHAQGVLGPDGTFSSTDGQYGAFTIDNLNNSSNSKTATSNGLVFLGTTTGNATALNQDVNIAVYDGSTLVVSLLLGAGGTGPASGDGTGLGGFIYDQSGATYYDNAEVGGATATLTLDIWTGNNVTWAAADAAGSGQFVDSVVFSQALGDAFGTPAASLPTDFTGMPAVVLTPVTATPEPTTLAFAGLGGLSMLLLRRRS